MSCCSRALALLACLLAAVPAWADEAGRDWLQRMTHALETSSYVGEYRIEGRGYAERMQIAHCVRDGVIRERLVSLDGPRREFIRRGEEVTAYLPDKGLAVVERRPGKGGLLAVLPQYDGEIEQWYDVVLDDRANGPNGRKAAVVSVKPRDGYRFGHRLWIDEATGMPVRTELFDASGELVERLSFTRLEIRREVPDDHLQPGVDAADYQWVRQTAHPPAGALAWQVSSPPPGFRLSASAVKDIVGVPSPVSQLVLSDGLASVSVFIHQPAAGQQPSQGSGRAGAASTFSGVVEGQQVTAVGEVPPQTLEAIVGSIVRRR